MILLKIHNFKNIHYKIQKMQLFLRKTTKNKMSNRRNNSMKNKRYKKGYKKCVKYQINHGIIKNFYVKKVN